MRIRLIGAVRVATLAVALACLVVPGALARRHHRPRPNLVISSGGASASGGRIAANFVVANVGSAKAGRSTAAVTLRVGRGVRTLARPRVGRLSAGKSAQIDASAPIPSGLAAGSYPIGACADINGAVHESSEGDNCQRLGRLVVKSTGPGPGSGSTVPANPVAFQADTVFTLQSAATTYWVDVPSNYDTSHRTPTELLVWLHGCGGEASGDIYTVSPSGPRPYISIAVGGREDDCWDPTNDQSKVLAAISDVETHFNIDRHEVVLGGYSSGGDLAYRTAFYHSLMFSGVLAENTSPFRDTLSTAAQSLAAAQWKFNVVHLAHTEDEVYPIDGVRQEIKTLKDAGFPVQLIEQPGSHYDNSTATSGTDHDLQTYLLPHLADGWRSP